MSAKRIVFNPRNMGELLACEIRLLEVLSVAIAVWPDDELVIGDIHRTLLEETAAGGKSGIHAAGPPFRAIDAKVAGATIEARWAKAAAVAGKLNERLIYDPARPEKLVAFAQPHGTGPHVHLQVHQNTRRRIDPALET